MNDQQVCVVSDSLDIILKVDAKHADLYQAAKKMGGQSALARYLDVSPAILGLWCQLRGMPNWKTPASTSRFKDPEFTKSFEKKLFGLTGKTLDELFPEGFRNRAFLKSTKSIEIMKSVELSQLTHEARHLLPDPSRIAEQKEAAEALRSSLRFLSDRHRKTIELRFGLGDSPPMELDEVGKILNVTAERVRQIEGAALRTLARVKSLENFKDVEFEDVSQ